jgi:hypothetical protein
MRRLLPLLLVLLAVGPARASDFPQAKMDFVDLSQAPKVTVGFSFLTSDLKPVKAKFVDVVSILRHAGRDDRKGTEARRLVKGKPLDKADDGELLTADKAGRPLDTVLIVAGYGNLQFTETELGAGLRDAVELVLKKLPKSGRLAVLWYNDLLWSRVMSEGRSGELTRLNPEQNQKLCRESRLEGYARDPAAQPPAGDDKEAPKGPACGLFPDDGQTAKILRSKARFEGYYPALFGLPDRFPEGTTPEHGNKAKEGWRADDESGYASVPTAFEEALRLLLLHGAPDVPKAIVLLSDGRDGSIEALDLWRTRWKETCRGKGGPSTGLGAAAAAEAVQACVQVEEAQFLTKRETFFARKVEAWLPLLRAANVRVFAVGLPTGAPYELERLRVLAQLTGGTYRAATGVESLAGAAAGLAGELTDGLVVTFTDPEATPERALGYSVRLEASRRSFGTQPLFGTVPYRPTGLKAVFAEKLAWLKSKVGSPWHWVLVVVAGLVLLLLAVLLVKKLVDLVAGLVKKAKAKAEGAAKAAAKMPGGLPKPPAVPKAPAIPKPPDPKKMKAWRP